MALRSLLAKDWVLEVATGPVETPTWTPVKGLTSFSETTDDNTEDDGDFESDGWGSTVVTQRTWSIEAEGRRKRSDATVFTPDPGQERIRQAGRVVGFDANIKVRWYRKDGAPDAYEGTATVSEFTKGGAVTDLEPFNFTLLGQGQPVEIENPVAA
ncbi:phage tail tube protein [Streptosporangium sp. OZ121]|uniref:phage tail tube protein n=1 Tax=Streptosporangium sp. OZ121 TaxID=3444183 RepID=UPI003F78C804